MGEAAKAYVPRRPESTVLHQVLATNLDAFRREVYARGKALPAYVEKEFAAFLDCGNLERGFVRLKCDECDHERLLAFSCKRRGFCPSCCGRRMNEAELRIANEVFPHQAARQWVLSMPMPLRFYCARNRPLISKLARIFCEGVEQAIRRNLRRRGVRRARSGGVLFIQRLGGALNLNVHFHAIFLDGGYVGKPGEDLVFHDVGAELTSEDVAKAVEKIAVRAVKMLRRAGLLDDDNCIDLEPDAIALCDGASVKNLIAFGARAGKPVRRIRIPTSDGKPRVVGELVAEMNGFNLKADKVVKAHQRWKLARLVRYVGRPPIATERLLLADDGESVRYVMKNPWSDGTVEIRLSGIEMVEKLASAVPPPRSHLVRYLGVLAPNASLRRHIVPVPKPKARDENGKVRLTATQRATWAKLAMHAFEADLTKCEICGGSVRRLAVICDSLTIAKILKHVGRARPPPLRVVPPIQFDPC